MSLSSTPARGKADIKKFVDAASVKSIRENVKKAKGADPFSPDALYRNGMVFLGLLLAEQWSGYVYIDPATFKVQGNDRKYWQTTYFGRQNKNYGSMVQQIELNCETFDQTGLITMFYDRRGHVKTSATGASQEALAPETIGRSMGTAVCSLPAALNCDGVYRLCAETSGTDFIPGSRP